MKKTISWLIVFIFMANLISPMVAYASEGPVSVHNGFVEYKVNRDNGRFTIHTTDGLPNKAKDNDKNLLFLKDLPDTSFTTFKIDGKDYIFGNSYGILGQEGGILSPPQADGNMTTTVWRIKDIEVTQKLQLITDESNPHVGNTKITYEVLNKGTSSVELGSRILLDTQLGSNDASPMLVGSTYITNETEYLGDGVPAAWKSADEKFAPGVISYGLLKGFDNEAPNRMVVAHWESLSHTKWDYTPNELINFTTDKNSYGSADSAVALYFEPKSLKNGQEIVYETFYGIGSISDSYNDANFNFQVNTPNKLTVNNEGTGYKEKSFKVVVSIDNGRADAEAITDATVVLGLSDELSFAPGQADRQFIKNIAAGETLAVEFEVVPTVCQSLKVAELGATIQYNGTYAEASKFVVLPSVKGAPPRMQMTEISPKIAYTKAQKKTFVIKGSDFDSLKADYQWTMYIKGKNSGISYQIKRKDIIITNDALTVSVDKDYDFQADNYDLALYSTAYGNMSKTIELSNDPKYDRKEYGTLLLGAFSKDAAGKPVYDVIALDKEEDYEKLSAEIKENTLLTLRGEIFEYEINGQIQYDCGSGTIINRSILYTAPTAEPNKCLTVKRYKKGGVDWWGQVEDSLGLTGKGFLTIGDYTFHYGDLYVVLNDGKEYELAEPTDGEKDSDYNRDNPLEDKKSKVEIITPTNVVGGEILKTVGLFTGTKITVKNAVIGSNTVSLGGSISVELPWWSGASDGKDDDDDDSKLKKTFDKNDQLNSSIGEAKKNDDLLALNLDEMRYGVSDQNSAYLVGLIANGSLQLDDDTIPKFDAGGAKAAFALDSLNYDGMYAGISAGFKVGEAFECEGAVSLVFETGGSCIPDSVELVLGGKVMRIPLGAGPANVGYLTKIGGGVYNLYNTIKGYYNVIPPLTLKLISGYADPTLYSFQLDTIALEFGLNGFQLTAEEGKVVGLKVLEKAYAKFLVYCTEYDGVMYPCVDIGAGISVNLLGIVKGEGSIWLVADPRIDSIFGHVSLGGKAYIGIFIPDYIPVLGGIELAAVMAELSTYRVYCGVRFLGIPFSVGYYWADKKVKFNDDFAYLAQELNIPMEDFENALGYEYVETNSNSDGLMIFGGNLRETYSSKRSGTSRLLAYDTKHEIEVSNQDYGLFELQYTGDMPKITVTKPDGSIYPLVLNENYITQTIDSEHSESGITEQMAYISVTDPEDGIWTITTDKMVDCTAMNVLALPELKNVNCTQISNEQLKISWDAANIDDSYTADIHLSEIQKTVDLADYQGNEEEYNKEMAAGYDPGIIVAKDIPAKNKEALVDITERLTSGKYQARVVLKKGDEVYDSELSSNTFQYVNPNVPEMPKNIKVSLGGDGQFKVTYDEVKNAKGYVVTVLDENGNEIEGFEGMITDKTKVYVGNKSSVATGYDQEGKPTGFKESGVIPGKAYRVKVYAYNEKDLVTYQSEEYISDAIYLPEPNPAEVTLKLNDTSATPADGNAPNTVGVTSNQKNSVIKYMSDQDVKVAYWVDGVTNGDVYEVKAGAPLEIPVTLDEGGSVVEFLAVNEANDYTTSKLIITMDTVKPELLIDSVSTLSKDGRYEIVGTTEPNAHVYIGDEKSGVPVVNGSFSYLGRQNSTRDEVKVMAVDAAGNETTMYVEVIPSELSSFSSIVIKNAVHKEIEQIEISQGDNIKIKVFGVSGNGEFELDHNNITYSVIYGQDKVSINENGEIEGKYEGEAVVLCEYYVTEDYNFEETLTVKVNKTYEDAKDIRISTVDIPSSAVGSPVARLSIPDAPMGVSYDYQVAENEYFELVSNQLILKKKMDVPSVAIWVTAQGKHVLDGVYENIGTPVSKAFTLKAVKNIVSAECFNSLTVYVGNEFGSLKLPEMINVTLDTGETVKYPVVWNQGAYNPSIAGTYNLKGTIKREANVNNPDDISGQISVTVLKRSSSHKKTLDEANLAEVLQDLTYRYEGETLVLTAKNNGNSVTLNKKILGIDSDNLKINLGNTEIVLDNATCAAMRALNNEEMRISALKKNNLITVNVENVKNAKGIIKTEVKEIAGAGVYNMVVLKDGKVLPNSYYDRSTGKMVFAFEGNGNYTVEKRNYHFGDTKGSWAENVISYVAARGLVNGVGGNNFAPKKNVTRADFLKMILSAMGIVPEKTTAKAPDINSKDWFAPYAAFALEKGIMSGYADGNFKPNKEITRQEMMVILNNCLKYKGMPLREGKISFSDRNSIPEWALSAVENVTALGLITGNSDGSLLPQKYTTRAESAAIMMRCIKLLTEHLK